MSTSHAGDGAREVAHEVCSTPRRWSRKRKALRQRHTTHAHLRLGDVTFEDNAVRFQHGSDSRFRLMGVVSGLMQGHIGRREGVLAL